MPREQLKSRRATYVLDTNVYRKIARRGLSLPTRLAGMVTLSYVTYMELMAQLQSCGPRTFSGIRAAIVLARQHAKRRFLHWPTDFVDMTLLGVHRRTDYKTDARKALKLAVRIRDASARNSPVNLGGHKYFLGDFSRERDRFQQDWIASFTRLKMLAEQYASYPAPKTGGIFTATAAVQVTAFVRSDQWRELYGRAILGEPGSYHPKKVSAADIGHALDAASCFVGAVLRAQLVDGYKVDLHGNDAYDHGQLQYLCDEAIILVTDDNRSLRQRVSHSTQAPRIMSTSEFLRRGNA